MEDSGAVVEQRNTSGIPMTNHHNTGGTSRTTEPYKTKNNCKDFKENLNLTLIHLTLSAQGGNIFYC